MSPEAVGQLLAANAWQASSRFREFLQQEVLTGRIVLALLSDRSVGGQSPIYPQTLQRLVSDLERVHSTGEWLKETRRFVADRLKGAGRGLTGGLASPEARASGREETPDASLCIRSSLMLTWLQPFRRVRVACRCSDSRKVMTPPSGIASRAFTAKFNSASSNWFLINQNGWQPGSHGLDDGHVGPDHPPKQIIHARDERRDFDGHRPQFLAARERQQPLCQRSTALHPLIAFRS